MDSLNITRKFRGATYNIQINNSGHQGRVKSLIVNGKTIDGNTIPYDENIKEYTVIADI